MEIIKENGKIWGVKKDLTQGVWHYTKYFMGEYKEEKKKTNKKGEEK